MAQLLPALLRRRHFPLRDPLLATGFSPPSAAPRRRAWHATQPSDKLFPSVLQMLLLPACAYPHVAPGQSTMQYMLYWGCLVTSCMLVASGLNVPPTRHPALPHRTQLLHTTH